ncbi:YvcK family protein [Candidatus Roizmanbacteria bacterium]|nr:YvcK family protein [Candidatus Roizmanbacteria bacterium]
MKTITVLGGGTGTFVVLTGIKNLPIDLGVIVTMMDSGGSTGRLRDQLGVLPPGDLRQCLVALSDAPELWRKLFLYRFEKGDFEGHNFGNIFLSALEKVSENYNQVLETASYVLKTKGKVIPVTFDKTNLCAEYENGIVLKGESHIDENHKETSRIKNAFLEPQASANPYALQRIEESNLIIIGPGDLYTSIIPIMLVEGMKERIRASQAKIVYVMNLMTKSGQTSGYTAMDHIKDLEHYLGKKPDHIIINNGKIPEDIIQWYTDHHEKPVVNDLVATCCNGTIIEEDVVDNVSIEKSRADVLTRSVLRHDSNKLSKIIQGLIAL